MKQKALHAVVVADINGFKLPKPIEGQPKPHYGRRALVGQYVRPYKRAGHLPEGAVVKDGVLVENPTIGRVSKGALKRYLKTHGTEGKLDFAESINARR